MTNRKQKILSGASALLVGALLLGAGTVHSAPVSLDDSTMDGVTAGTTAQGGGVVIGNSSGAAVGRSEGLGLSDDAQQFGEGLNIVNSVGSAVADGVNIWDGNGVTAPDQGGGEGSTVLVNQANDITQEQLRSATVSGYSRPEAEHKELYHRTSSDSHDNRVVDSHDTTAIFEEVRLSNTTATGEVNTRLKFNIDDKFDFEGNLGQGVAAAGHTDISFDGGSADIALVLGGGISVGADSADFNKPLELAGLDFGTSGIAAGIDVEAEITLTATLELPKLDIVLDGAGCAVAMGSCSAASATSEVTHTKTDNSTLDIIEFYQSGQSSYSELRSTSHRSPFELKSARAEYIVIDDSSLELESEVTLELSDSAQKDVKGMNVVNAIGSNVANATNVSRTTRFEGLWSTLVLNQSNTVHHGR